MPYTVLIVEKANHIATITLNRPDKLNAWNDTIGWELHDALIEIDKDKEARVLVITGAGRAFSAGADMDWFLKGKEERTDYEEGLFISRVLDKIMLQLRNMQKPVIASINGPAFGAGMTMALQCDIRIASEDAAIRLPFAHYGLVPENGSTHTLTRLVGIAKACELVFTAKTIGAREAKEIGLVNVVTSASELKKTTDEMAQKIACAPPLGIRMSKRGLYQGLDSSFENQLQFESAALDILFQTEDHREAIIAFKEGRKPVFKGR